MISTVIRLLRRARACGYRCGAAAGVLALAVLGAARAPAAPAEPTHITPPPQPPLEAVDDSTWGEIRDAFNAASGLTRLLVVLSPT